MRSRFRKRPSTPRGGDNESVDIFFGELESRAESPAAQRKLKQLCREVYRVLSQVLPGDTRDPVLDGVSVVEVRPAPDASRLAVSVEVAATDDAGHVLEHLKSKKGYLRSEIARAIQRKRTPELVFEVSP